MLFVFGDRVDSKSTSIGSKVCNICNKEQPFSHVVETNYFCIFGFRILPIEKFANYYCCDHCNNSYELDDLKQPAQVQIIKRVLIYIQLGYWPAENRELSKDICLKVTGCELLDEEIRAERLLIETGKVDVLEVLKDGASSLNLQGKQQIIESAFLITHACCEIQYEDRLRLNLMGNALNVSIEFVTSVINQVHAHGCYGVRRLLPTQTQQSKS
ncbi:MAG: hypothetical protein KUG79_01635 [Pseudomonadales bacterium]|nr:hypothetical protein [Pseudomonadales bacterium]